MAWELCVYVLSIVHGATQRVSIFGQSGGQSWNLRKVRSPSPVARHPPLTLPACCCLHSMCRDLVRLWCLHQIQFNYIFAVAVAGNWLYCLYALGAWNLSLWPDGIMTSPLWHLISGWQKSLPQIMARNAEKLRTFTSEWAGSAPRLGRISVWVIATPLGMEN